MAFGGLGSARFAILGASAMAIAAGVLLLKRRRLITSVRQLMNHTSVRQLMNKPAPHDMWRLSATEVVEMLKAKRVSAVELVESALARIDAINPAINAVISVRADAARAQASRLDAMPHGAPGPLHGLPVLVKECHPVEGEPWTVGSPAYAARIASKSHVIVRDIEAAGGIIIGITNQPEHAAGSHTFNPVYGTTKNPYDLRASAGGSSGGSTAALAAGGAWLATGTDLGGSLRNPAAFCGTVGLRTSPGRVSMGPLGAGEWRGRWGLGLHSVAGPLARSVRDAALLLDVLTASTKAKAAAATAAKVEEESFEAPYLADGWESFALPDLPPPPAEGYLAYVNAASAHKPNSVAWSVNLGGVLQAVHPSIAAAVERCAALLAAESGDALLQQAAPRNLGHAHNVFMTLRHCRMVDLVTGGPDQAASWLQAHGDLTKPEILWEIERALTPGWKGRVAAAEHARQEIERSFLSLFALFDVLVLPCTLMPAFDAELRYPARCVVPAADAGETKPQGSWSLNDYAEWMLPCTVVSLSNLPAISVPAGFDDESGLPIGVQLVGRAGDEANLLAAAALLEKALGLSPAPIDPREAGGGAEQMKAAPPLPSSQRRVWSGPRTAEDAKRHLAKAPKVH